MMTMMKLCQLDFTVLLVNSRLSPPPVITTTTTTTTTITTIIITNRPWVASGAHLAAGEIVHRKVSNTHTDRQTAFGVPTNYILLAQPTKLQMHLTLLHSTRDNDDVTEYTDLLVS